MCRIGRGTGVQRPWMDFYWGGGLMLALRIPSHWKNALDVCIISNARIALNLTFAKPDANLVDGLKSINPPPPVGINPPSPNTNSTHAIASPSIDWDNIIILNREDRDDNTRQVREAIQIRR